MVSKFLGLLAVDPCTGQLKIMIQANNFLLDTLASKQAYFSATLKESARLMNNFAPMHLHNINRLPSYALDKYLPEYFKGLYYGPRGFFRTYAEIKEILTMTKYDASEIKNRQSVPAQGQ